MLQFLYFLILYIPYLYYLEYISQIINYNNTFLLFIVLFGRIIYIFLDNIIILHPLIFLLVNLYVYIIAIKKYKFIV
jgi:hypothetical protein